MKTINLKQKTAHNRAFKPMGTQKQSAAKYYHAAVLLDVILFEINLNFNISN